MSNANDVPYVMASFQPLSYNQSKCQGCLNSAGDTSKSVDISLKDKLAGFFSGLNSENSATVRKVERMVSEQRDEIDTLSCRIVSLNRQMERQKDYFTKREQILKDMYEEELSLIEDAYERSGLSELTARGDLTISPTAAPVMSVIRSLQPPHPPSGMQLRKDSQSRSSDDADCVSSSKSDVSTQIEVRKPTTMNVCTSPIKFRSLDAACLTAPMEPRSLISKSVQSEMCLPTVSIDVPLTKLKACSDFQLTPNPPIKARSLDIGCLAKPLNTMIAKSVQSDMVLLDDRNDKTLACEYKTCSNESPLEAAGNILETRLDKELEDDDALVEVEKLHKRTRHLYGKLNAALREFHGSADKPSSPICVKDRSKPDIQANKASPSLPIPFLKKESKAYTDHRGSEVKNANTNALNTSDDPLRTPTMSGSSKDESVKVPLTVKLKIKDQNQKTQKPDAKNSSDVEILEASSPPEPGSKADVTMVAPSPSPSQFVSPVSASEKTVMRNPLHVPIQPLFLLRRYNDNTLNSDVSTIQTLTCGDNF